MDFDYEEPIEKRFEDLCQDLCIEGAIREEAWEKYKDVWANYSIDGDQIQWLVCSLYECCRRSISDSLSGHVVDNAYVSLSRLLSAAKMSMVQFFHRIRKWADMTDMLDDMRDRVELLERQFAVSSVIFRNFGGSFGVLFCDFNQNLEKVHPTGTDLFRFTWLLFIKSRASFPAVTDDLVNSYHLLACCLDWVLGAVMLSRRSDLVNLELTWLPKDFLNAANQKKTWCPPHDEPPCMLRPICQENGVHYVECKTVKEHFFRPFILRLIEKEFIKLNPPVYGSLLEPSNFDITLQNLNNNYEEYIIGTGDFDERIYLSPNAAEEIGSTGETAIESNLGLSTDLAPSARRYMLELSTSGFGGFTETTRRGSANAAAVSRLNGGVNFSNPEARNQNLNQLQTLLAGRSKEPTEALIDLIESHCSSSPLISMHSVVDGLVATFQRAYVSSVDLAPDRVEEAPGTGGTSLAVSAAQQRLHLGCTLYYLALENILVDEVRKIEKRLNVSSTVGSETGTSATRRFKPDLTGLLTQELFHRSLFACCMELVLISCDPPDHHFPWILNALDLDAFDCFKVIEVVIRNVDFPRDVVKYMHQVTGLILDSYAWRTKSPLWTALKAAGRAPTIEEVIAPEKLEQNHSSSGISIRSDAVTTDVRKMGVSGSGLIIKSGALKQPRLLASTNTSVSTSLLRTRSSDLNTNTLPRRLMLASGGVEDESAQAAAQLLASGEEDIDPSASTNLLNVPTEEVHLTGADGNNNKALLENTATVDVSADSGQSLWSAATNVLLNYYPARHDSLAIFFRQFYVMASLRLRDLCERLNLQRDLMTKVWTCLEQAVVHETGLFRDRCLDQILLSCLYGVCKVVLYRPLSFLDIIQVYRMQPQSHRDIYRSVLINHVTYGRTSGDERGDISRFYNLVFLNKMKDYVRKASSSSYASRSGVGAVTCSDWAGQPALAPMPIHPNTAKSTAANPTGNVSSGPGGSQPGSEVPQARRLASNRNIFISPVKQQVNLSPKRVVFTIGRSSGKDLQDVNLMISSAERRASMANLTMGLKRPGGGTTTGYVSNSHGFTISPATSGAPRTVTLMGPGTFASKRIDFDM